MVNPFNRMLPVKVSRLPIVIYLGNTHERQRERESFTHDAQGYLYAQARPTSFNNRLLLCYCHNNYLCCKDDVHLRNSVLYWVSMLLEKPNYIRHPSYKSKMFGLIGWLHVHYQDNNRYSQQQ